MTTQNCQNTLILWNAIDILEYDVFFPCFLSSQIVFLKLAVWKILKTINPIKKIQVFKLFFVFIFFFFWIVEQRMYMYLILLPPSRKSSLSFFDFQTWLPVLWYRRVSIVIFSSCAVGCTCDMCLNDNFIVYQFWAKWFLFKLDKVFWSFYFGILLTDWCK